MLVSLAQVVFRFSVADPTKRRVAKDDAFEPLNGAQVACRDFVDGDELATHHHVELADFDNG